MNRLFLKRFACIYRSEAREHIEEQERGGREYQEEAVPVRMAWKMFECFMWKGGGRSRVSCEEFESEAVRRRPQPQNNNHHHNNDTLVWILSYPTIGTPFL
ncbi:hypothetical protein K1719_001130 [Acacia pycnantha]|nr:hypothetical protein K1719_001130 [Acacia pycnantha]